MGDIYLGSDWHFLTTPFRTDSSKNKKILDRYIRTVKDDDVFIFLGDLTYFNKDCPEVIKSQIEQIKSLPGNKIFIRGNNDYENLNFYKSKMKFDLSKDILIVDKFIFTHKPISLDERQVEKGYINIHGHIHGSKEYDEYYCDPVNHADCYSNEYNFFPARFEDVVSGSCSFIQRDITETEIRNLYNKLYKHCKIGF